MRAIVSAQADGAIEVHDLEVPVLTGIYSEETHLPQPLRISMTVDLDCPERFAPDTPLSDTNAQLVQLLGHTRPAVAAQAQPMLFADMRQDHHVAPLTDGRGPEKAAYRGGC